MELSHRTIQLRQQVFVNLLQENDWDFAAIDFTTIDRIQGLIWIKRKKSRNSIAIWMPASANYSMQSLTNGPM